ncbi:MAG: hypothetical protein F4194_03500, partial [Acidimicrobiia bacterium]|nr:hypothetical protein [Acidimicrobiia bacterium]
MPFVVLAQTLTEACGADPQAICRLVYDLTGSTGGARFADFASRPVKVVIILVLAWLANRMVRRWLNRAVEGWLERRAAVAEAARDRSDEASERKEGGLREAALQRASLMLEQQERSTQ